MKKQIMKKEIAVDLAGNVLTTSTCIAPILWAVWGIFSAFSGGHLPLVSWSTDLKLAFGFVWLVAVIVVLIPLTILYLFIAGFDVRTIKEDRRFWYVVVGHSILHLLATYCLVLASVAWFPSPLPPPFTSFRGGPIPGIVVLVGVLILLSPGMMLVLSLQRRLVREGERRETEEKERLLGPYIVRLTEISRQTAASGSAGFLGSGMQECRKVGVEIDKAAGFKGMQYACDRIREELGPNAARELEYAWDRIGEWLG